jgi:hypothetical protein
MFGFGSRNPQMRQMRILLLVVLLVAGAAFHDKGTAYTIIRVAYYAVILGGLGFILWRRQVAKRQPMADGATGRPHAQAAASAEMAGREAGWFPDQQDMKVQRYWDGSAWTRTRRWENDQWVDT